MVLYFSQKLYLPSAWCLHIFWCKRQLPWSYEQRLFFWTRVLKLEIRASDVRYCRLIVSWTKSCFCSFHYGLDKKRDFMFSSQAQTVAWPLTKQENKFGLTAVPSLSLNLFLCIQKSQKKLCKQVFQVPTSKEGPDGIKGWCKICCCSGK